MVKYKSITTVSKLLLFISLFFAVMTVVFAFFHHSSSIANKALKIASEDVYFNSKNLSEVMNKVVSGDMDSFDLVNKERINLKNSFKKLYGDSAEYEMPDQLVDVTQKLNDKINDTEAYLDKILSNRELFEIANNRKNSLVKTFQELIFVSDKAIAALQKHKGSSSQIFYATKLQYYFQSLYSLVLQSYNTNIDPKYISSDFMEHSSIADEILQGLLTGRSALRITKIKTKAVRNIFSVLQVSYQSAQVTLLERLSGSYEIKEHSVNLENNNQVMSELLRASNAVSTSISNFSNTMLINSLTLGVSFAVSILFFIFTILSFFYDAKLKFTSYFNDSSVIVEESKKVNSELELLLDEVSPLLDNQLGVEASVRSNSKTVGVARAFNYAIDKLKEVIDSGTNNKIVLEKSISNLAKLNKNIDIANGEFKKKADFSEKAIVQINSQIAKAISSLRDIKAIVDQSEQSLEPAGIVTGQSDTAKQALLDIEQALDECIKANSTIEAEMQHISSNAVKSKVSINRVSELLNKLDDIAKKMDEVTSSFKDS